MNRNFIDSLKSLKDVQIDTHSGSYELVEQGVVCLSKIPKENFDVCDVEMLWHFGNLNFGKNARNNRITASNLIEEDKRNLIVINERIAVGSYTNYENGKNLSNGNCGLFDRATAKIKTNKEISQMFITMLIAISKIDNTDDIFRIAEECLTKDMRGLGAGIVSQILHLLKPNLFPVLNRPGQEGYTNKIGLSLFKAKDIHYYIRNARIIKNFRDNELPNLNFRTIDIALYGNGEEFLAERDTANVNNAMPDSSSFNYPLDDETIIVDKKNSFYVYRKKEFLAEVYMNDEKYEDIIALLERKQNIILQGAPGVGKSFLAKKLAYSRIGFKDTNKVEMVQFHQSYSYEDFIEGFRPGKNGNFEIKQGTFFRFCKKAIADSKNKYFFIIDEINRGNISKIMGELMLLLEKDKRGKEHAMSLTYSGDKFYVPDNVYVIGMMNTADRSLAMIDYALRRRFSFVPVEPAFDNKGFILKFKDNYHDADAVINKMKELNAFITVELDSGHQIGHSYFCSDKHLNDKDIEGIFKYEIKELLHEYFFDNKSKLDEALAIL